MKSSLNYRIRRMLLPGLKRWILIVAFGIVGIVLGVFLLLGYHPITVSGLFLREVMEHAAEVLPHRVSGLIVISAGGLLVCFAIARLTMSVVGAYLPSDREAIPDVLYRRRHLDSGPIVVVIGGGHGLANLLKGLKNFTNNITAIVTVGDDGGSSGRLREELGVLPPGDIRNCITALADEDKLVTELFQYRFESGRGLEGHSFGNLFLTALCAITHGDMVEAGRTASRVLKSAGQVLPSTLASVTLVAHMEDGRTVAGESQIPSVGGRIQKLTCEPAAPKATPEAIQAIVQSELIVLGPGSLYTSIVPNLLVDGIVDAIRQSPAKKIYVCNVMTQPGETIEYTVADHVATLFQHAGLSAESGGRLLEAVLVNDQLPTSEFSAPSAPVKFDPERLKEMGVRVVRRPVLSAELAWHHDANRLAKALMFWFIRQGRGGPKKKSGAPALLKRLASFF